MHYRCRVESNPSYSHYGGKGIKVCERWSDFENFLEDMGEKPEGYSLDRIDNSKDYSPENCKWSTMREQNNNRTNNKRYKFMNKELTLTEWSEVLGVPRTTLLSRLRRGKSVEEALY